MAKKAENVKKALAQCSSETKDCTGCPYAVDGVCLSATLSRDALEVIRGLEVKKGV